jgi:AcrR family transcriptional regulator
VRRRKRAYNSPARRLNAEQTRAAILAAARKLFLDRGYAAATMSEIAKSAGVVLDTVYASVGPKPTLFRLLVESALSGRNEAVPAEEREYVRAIRAEPEAERKLEIYAHAVAALQPRLAPLIRVLQVAANSDSDLRSLWREISQRRAANMRKLARDLDATGRLRRDLSIDEVADVVWSMNGPEYYWLLVEERGWTVERFEAWLADSWKRLLLGS